MWLGVVHKLRLQEEESRLSKNVFVNIYKVEDFNGGGYDTILET